MSVYATGSVNIKVGSQTVSGNGTDFSTYVSSGYLFKRTGDSTFYEVAAIVSATNLTLTGRYADTDNQTSRPSEHLATMTTATKMYSGTPNNTPVIRNSVVLNASIEDFTDDGAGVLTGDGTPAGSGTIDYDTGAWSITLGTDLTATATINASYYSGDTLSAVPYQIFVDYTPNKEFPEMSVSDMNFAHIYTKAIRMVDSAFYSDNVKPTAADYSATDTDQVIVVGGNTTNVIITLPPATSDSRGRKMRIFNNSASNVTATCYATPQSIEGAVSTTLTSQYQSIEIQVATTNLWIRI